jgi:hypothetical protein
MGEATRVNGEPRAFNGANYDGMVSAACATASTNVNGACVPVHAAGLRMIAGERSSMPRLVTGACDRVSSIAAGAELQRVPTHTPGAQRAAIADGCGKQHAVHQHVPRDARGLADRDPETAPTEHHRSVSQSAAAVVRAVLRVDLDLTRLHGG